MHAGIPPGPGTHPPGLDTPPNQAPPPRAEHTGRYGQRAGGTHPTVMQSCIITAYICSLWEGNVFSHVFLCSQPGIGLDIRPGDLPASDISVVMTGDLPKFVHLGTATPSRTHIWWWPLKLEHVQLPNGQYAFYRNICFIVRYDIIITNFEDAAGASTILGSLSNREKILEMKVTAISQP